MELILLGPPGSGKGTQADVLAEKFSVPHISTGAIFRKNLEDGTSLGQLARRYMDAGTLVPDDVTEAMVQVRLGEADAESGFILDGFPRTLPQGEHFRTMLDAMRRVLTAAVYLDVKREVLMERLTGRRLCGQCGRTYHVTLNPPKHTGHCDVCGGQLIQRADDGDETVSKRLSVYEVETAPLIDFYQSQGILLRIDGERAVDAVTVDLGQQLARLP